MTNINNKNNTTLKVISMNNKTKTFGAFYQIQQ